MKKNAIPVLLTSTITILMSSIILTGCSIGRGSSNSGEIDDLTETGSDISDESATTGIDSSDKDFEEQLVSGTYYVVHDGIYYPVDAGVTNYDTEDTKDYVDPDRQIYFTTENEIDIPTLYEGDSLVYYSTDTLLDYVTWERYYDFGYTIGVYDIQQMESGRAYLDLSDDDDCILEDSELYDIYDLGVDEVLLDKIGGVEITDDLVSCGLIASAQKSKSYDLEVYAGTYYKHYTTTANVHAFRAYELFNSIEYEALQDCFYQIDIPDYFVNGYYDVNGVGLLRYVTGTSYSDSTDFNEQLLYAMDSDDEVASTDPDDDDYVAPAVYSDYEDLNSFTTSQVGALGYVDEDADTDASEETDISSESTSSVLEEATVKNVDLWFPQGEACTITITSPTSESTGDCYVTIGDSTTALTYDRIDGVYSATISGVDKEGTLTVSGLWNSYDIELINCEQYDDQDGGASTTTETTDDTEAAETAEETTEVATETAE